MEQDKTDWKKKLTFHLTYIFIIASLTFALATWGYINYHHKTASDWKYQLETCETMLENVSPERGLRQSIRKLQPKLDDVVVEEYVKWITYFSKIYRLPPKFVACVISRESDFNNMAVSTANAKGPMQVIYKYHKKKCDKLGIKENELYTIRGGIGVGCEVLREYLNSTGDFRKALLKYVGGQHNQYVNDIFERFANISVTSVYVPIESVETNSTTSNSTKGKLTDE